MTDSACRRLPDRDGARARMASRVALSVLATWMLPSLAAACSTCLGGDTEASRKAFIGTTAFMTFFPLLMLGGVIGWFVRRALAHEREADAQAQADSEGVVQDAELRGVVRPLR